LIVGILTSKALKGYKKEITPFKERFEIMRVFSESIGFKLVSQNSLDPSYNIKKYRPDYIASGDGWEKVELEAVKKYRIKTMVIPLAKRHSSSDIIKKIKKC
jgi:bifunctional ADP-heptose synthase (sugar kinase/adenylyltransferase)